MKVMKRICAALMAVILLISGVLPVYAESMNASSVHETMQDEKETEIQVVEEAQNERLQEGQWSYWLYNDYAVIAGYADHQAASLSIPETLGGHIVAGIGERAFSENTGLSTIYIPFLVKQIAENAFEGLSGLQIYSHNGAYALQYGNEHGIPVNNRSCYEFNEQLIDLTGISSKHYSNLTETSVQVDTVLASSLKTGDIIYFPGSGVEISDGSALQITSVSENGSGAVFSLEQPYIGMVFNHIKAEEELTLDWEHAEFAEGVDVDGDISASGTSVSFEYALNQKVFKKVGIKGGGKITVGPASSNIDVRWHRGWPSGCDVDISMPIKTSNGIELSYEISKKSKRLTPRITLAKVPIASAGGFSGFVTIDMVVSVDGKIKATFTTDQNFKFSYKNGKTNYSYSKDVNKSVEGSANLSCGPKISVYFVFGIANFSIRFFQADITLYLKVSVAVKGVKVNGGTDQVGCGSCEISLAVGIALKIGLVKVRNANGPHGSLSASRKLTIAKVHMDIGYPFGICTLKKRKITYQAFPGKSSYVHDVCDVNKYIKEPARPSRKGYKFVGWYLDTSKSGFAGSDFKWNFSGDRMPYVANQGTLYFYAKWSKLPAGHENDGEDKFPGATSNPKNSYKTPKSTWGGIEIEEPEIAPPTYVDPGSHELVVPVSRIELDKTNITVHSKSTQKTEKITAKVFPDNAKNKEVDWFSSNDEVAVVDANGNVTLKGAGSAEITCRSRMINNVIAVCTVRVVQQVEEVNVVPDKSSLVPGETTTAVAKCFPLAAVDAGVTWKSENEKVATVDANGTVKAIDYGQTNIVATSKDGSEVSGKAEIIVEKELALECEQTNDTLYLQGGAISEIGSVRLTSGSLERMRKEGYELEWSLEGPSDIADVTLDVSELNYNTNDNSSHISDIVYLNTEQLKAVGNGEYTVTCKAGPYTATAKFKITVSDTEFSQNIGLESTVYYGTEEEWFTIEPKVTSADGGTLPDHMKISIIGDAPFQNNADVEPEENGLRMLFRNSSVYQAELNLSYANLVYQIPVAFYIKDQKGIVHVPVSEIHLDKDAVQMMEGESLSLKAETVPSDAYDNSLEWESADPEIVTVDENGNMKAVGSGNTMIICRAKDGSGVEAYCSVNVESYLCLDESKVDITLYKQGEVHTPLTTVNLTYLSEKRLKESGEEVTWSLLKTSGNSTEIGLNEYESLTGDDFAVSGNQLELLRINEVGEDTYVLTCKAGVYSDTCTIHIRVVDEQLPDEISVQTTEYQTRIGETLILDSTPVYTPEKAVLPEDTVFSVEGSSVFLDALSEEYDFTNPTELKFKKAGKYQVDLVWQGGNYRYSCSIQIEVQDENGNVPKIIEQIALMPEETDLMPGESVKLTCSITPDDAEHSQIQWQCYDDSIVSVSEDGVITAKKTGTTIVTATVAETQEVGSCVVYVEDKLTMEKESVEKRVFIDGETRSTLMNLMLTDTSSKRLKEAPQWELKKVSGDSVTLRATGITSVNDTGIPLYGCQIELYSIARLGDTVYDLYCRSGDETAVTQITLHSVNRDDELPATVTFEKTVYEADINELISVSQNPICWPEDRSMPDGVKVSWSGDRQYLEALNFEDFRASQSLSTFSFSMAGTYEAECIYTYNNSTYRIPVTFRIRDEYGTVPVQARQMKLNEENLYLTAGETFSLKPIFTPSDATNKKVIWKTMDSSVAKVDENGNVTAVGNGMTTIVATPLDSRCGSVSCAVTVEDMFTVDGGATEQTLYLQGRTENEVAVITLSEGTKKRLEDQQIGCEWTLKTKDVLHSELELKELSEKGSVIVSTRELKAEGVDTFTVTCKAGKNEWSQQYQLNIKDLGTDMPDTIAIADPLVEVDINTPVTIDFKPAGTDKVTEILNRMTAYYVGIGEFYNGLDYSAYQEKGDEVTVAFTKPGRYVLTRQYFLGNLRYATKCIIVAGFAEDEKYQLLTADRTSCTIYEGGTAGAVATVSLTDAMVSDIWGADVDWSLTRVSGDSISAELKKTDDSEVQLVVKAVEQKGTDIWRVNCSFGGITDFIDITLQAVDARGVLPDSIELCDDRWNGTTGSWINIPLGVSCHPEGSVLPDTGDEFWSFTMDKYGRGAAEATIANNFLKVRFSKSGYYSGLVAYQSGNVHYKTKIVFMIGEEEEQSQSCLIYPNGLQVIEAEAFGSGTFMIVDLRDTAVTTIGARAFRKCTDLEKIYIPDSVISIGEDAFEGCRKLTVYCSKGSCADIYAQKNGIAVKYW